MAEFTTYLFPAAQALFCLIIAGVWLVGFLRQRNFGFLLLTLATLAEGLTSIIRQALTNYVIFHQPYLSAAQRSSTIGMIAMTVLGIYIVFWLAITLGAILVVAHRSKQQSPGAAIPPVSG
jgi:fucose permease